MLFSESAFLFIFLPLLIGIYFLLRGPLARFRNLLLLVFSLFFYAWGEKIFVLAMLASIAFNYLTGLWVDAQVRRGGGRFALICAVFGNLAFLGVYKYADFFVHNWNALVGSVANGALAMAPPHIELPIGISFFTFQAMSYVIDVYRRQTPVNRNPLDIAMYVALFPQLIAGPIVRYTDVAAEIRKRQVTRDGFAEGIHRFVLGLGKKMILANTCAYVADHIFGSGADIKGVPLEHMTAGLAWLAIICYSLQIYFDFSGYSDMAIGLGLVFGFRFMENFNYPYISRSITEFWRRWHISLSTWFRDYLYIPLGGNRGGRGRTYFNLVVVFFLCGLWHGASWTFVVWGMFHGCFLVLERMGLGKALQTAWRPIGHACTLLMVMVGWVVFRVATLEQAVGFLAAMAGFGAGAGEAYFVAMYLDSYVVMAMALGALAATPVWPFVAGTYRRTIDAIREPTKQIAAELTGQTAATVVLGCIFILAALLVAAGSYNPFIYFRF